MQTGKNFLSGDSSDIQREQNSAVSLHAHSIGFAGVSPNKKSNLITGLLPRNMFPGLYVKVFLNSYFSEIVLLYKPRKCSGKA